MDSDDGDAILGGGSNGLTEVYEEEKEYGEAKVDEEAEVGMVPSGNGLGLCISPPVTESSSLSSSLGLTVHDDEEHEEAEEEEERKEGKVRDPPPCTSEGAAAAGTEGPTWCAAAAAAAAAAEGADDGEGRGGAGMGEGRRRTWIFVDKKKVRKLFRSKIPLGNKLF